MKLEKYKEILKKEFKTMEEAVEYCEEGENIIYERYFYDRSHGKCYKRIAIVKIEEHGYDFLVYNNYNKDKCAFADTKSLYTEDNIFEKVCVNNDVCYRSHFTNKSSSFCLSTEEIINILACQVFKPLKEEY